MVDVFEETSRCLVRDGPYMGHYCLLKRKEQDGAKVFSEWLQ